MRRLRGYFAGLACLALASCSSVEEFFDEPFEAPPPAADGSSLAGIDGNGIPQAPPPVSVTQPPPFSATVGEPGRPTVSPTPTGTFVGKKALQIDGDVATLEQSVRTHTQQLDVIRNDTRGAAENFHSIVAGINTRLQVGTTRGNPILNQQWAEAQGQLARIGDNVLKLEELRSRLATDATLGGFLLDQVQSAYSLSGAVEEDHRQLERLEDRVNSTIVFVERQLAGIDNDISRQSAYVSRERRNLSTLALAIKNGEFYGPNLQDSYSATARGAPGTATAPTRQTSARTASSDSAPKSAQAAAARASSKSNQRDPVVVINFSKPNVEYETELYAAVSDAVAAKPGAAFEVMAVSPGADGGASMTSARRSAKRVMRSLINMGVPPSRLKETSQTATDVSDDQVRVFVL